MWLMGILSPDTSPEAEVMLLEMMRQTPPWRKMELISQMHAMARNLALAGLRHRHPDASEVELRRRLADLMLGEDLALKAYGPLVVEERVDE